jgi:hypothetical protein
VEVPMSLEYCYVCHIPFSITDDLRNALLKCHNTFYCPNGHGQHFTGKSNEEILREKLSSAQSELCAYQEAEERRKAKERNRKRKVRKQTKR